MVALTMSIMETYNDIMHSLSTLSIPSIEQENVKTVLNIRETFMSLFLKGIYSGVLKSQKIKEKTIPTEQAKLIEKEIEKNQIKTILLN